MAEMCLKYSDYNRISDNVMWLGFGATLKFVVDLFHTEKSKRGNEIYKENFHKEFLYTTTNDNDYKVKISRNFAYYFLIEINSKDMKDSVRITVQEIYFVIFNLKRAMQWFIGENGINKVFSMKKDGSLFIPSHPDPIKVSLSFGQSIEFEPAIYNINGYDTIGIKVYLNDNCSYFFMTSDVLFSFYHMLNSCNMYMMAQNMLNYIGRPEYGTNLTNINSSAFNNENYQPVKKESFFEKVGAIKAN